MVRKYTGVDLEKILLHFGLINLGCENVVKIVCPFHDDVNPSMLVDFVKGSFYCFGCGLSGNVFDFIKLTFPELNDLQCMLKIERIVNNKESKTSFVKKRKKKKIDVKKSLYEADDYFYGLRKTDWNDIKTEEEKHVLEYMRGRGFNERALNVGDCRVSLNMDYPIVFPILDNGKFCGYVCRTTNKKVEGYRKYLYNEGMKKREILCGNYEENKPLVVCEGFFDYLSVRTRGNIKNVVSLLGWHLSDMQCEKIKQKNINIIICMLDNPKIDKAGENGLNLLRKHFEHVIEYSYPDNIKDPGDMSKKDFERGLKKVKNEIKMLCKN